MFLCVFEQLSFSLSRLLARGFSQLALPAALGEGRGMQGGVRGWKRGTVEFGVGSAAAAGAGCSAQGAESTGGVGAAIRPQGKKVRGTRTKDSDELIRSFGKSDRGI